MIVTIIKGFTFIIGVLGLAFGAFLVAILVRDEMRLRLARRGGKDRRRRGHTPHPAPTRRYVPGLPEDGIPLDGYERAKLALVKKGYEAADAVSDSSDEKESHR